MKKKIKKLLLVFFLMLIYSYLLVISNIPDEIVLFEGESIMMKSILGLNIKNEAQTIEAVSKNGQINTEKTGKKTLQVSLFDNIPIKNVDVNVLPKTKVIPVGNIAGVKLYTSGVLVVGMSEIEGHDNRKYKPYENTGIKEGDTITQINDEWISSKDELIQTVNQSEGKELKVKYIHAEEVKECSIEPVKTTSNEYKLGLWVRDSAAGVGTVTFYEPETKIFRCIRTWDYRYRYR